MSNKALIPINKSLITKFLFNRYEFYYKVNSTDYEWSISYEHFLKKSEIYFDWFIEVPIDKINEVLNMK